MNIITGTHRSGTSLVARLLLRAGSDFGNPDGFYPADRWNPDGYFEQSEVLRLNRALLQGSWGKLANIAPPSTLRVCRRGEKLADALRKAAMQFQGCTVKDPRFNYTGPAWEQHGTRIEKIVVCLREPMDVARSLQRRNHLPMPLGLHVWRDCIQRLFDNYGYREMWFVNYARLVSNNTCVEETAGLIRYMGLAFNEEHSAGWIRAVIRTSDGQGISNRYPRHVDSAWQKCLALVQRQNVLARPIVPSASITVNGADVSRRNLDEK